MSESIQPAQVGSNAELCPRPLPEPVARLLSYSGKTMRTARCPGLTAREAIAVGDWMAAVALELADRRQQLYDEKRQHDITRGELERTRLVRDEALRVSVDDLNAWCVKASAEIERLRAMVLEIADKRHTYGWGPEADAAIDAARLACALTYT